MVRRLSPCRPSVNSGERVGGSRGPDRLLGLELPRLARRLLSRRAARAAVAGGLRGALRHRRGEHDLLPAPGTDGGGAVGGSDAGRLRVRREGQPLPDAHPPAARRGRRDGAPGRAHRAARRGRPAAGDALAAAGELPPRRRAPRRRAGRAAARPARVRTSPRELVRRRRGELLRERDVAFVVADDARAELPEAPVTASWHYLRFHYGHRGRRGNYGPSELDAWARRIRALRGDVLAYFNNDWEAFAPRNAEGVLERLRG